MTGQPVTQGASPQTQRRSRISWRVASLCLGLALAGCNSLPPLSPPGASDQHVVASQWLQIRHAEKSQEAICLLEITGTALRLVATTPQGQTLLKATLDATGQLKSEMATWVQQSGLDPVAIARDIQIALWPANALRAAGWQIDESANPSLRVVTLHGVKWAHIRYEGSRQHPQRIDITRADGLYSVTLQTLEWTEL